MWYFSWILGLGLALTFGVLNAIWYEITEQQRQEASQSPSSIAGKAD
jgi:cyd operon protein YbgT